MKPLDVQELLYPVVVLPGNPFGGGFCSNSAYGERATFSRPIKPLLLGYAATRADLEAAANTSPYPVGIARASVL